MIPNSIGNQHGRRERNKPQTPKREKRSPPKRDTNPQERGNLTAMQSRQTLVECPVEKNVPRNYQDEGLANGSLSMVNRFWNEGEVTKEKSVQHHWMLIEWHY
jgi:hypothetical protein